MAVITYRQALHDTLRAELLRDEDVFLMGEEIGLFEGSTRSPPGFWRSSARGGSRDTPICELSFRRAGFGAAMARSPSGRGDHDNQLLDPGKWTRSSTMGPRFTPCSGGRRRCRWVLRTPGGAGQQLAATHSQNLEVWFAHIPGLKVVAPATPADAKGLLTTSIRDNDPVIFVENSALYNTKATCRRRAHRRDRPGPLSSGRHRPHRCRLLPHDRRGPRRRPPAGRGRATSPSRWSTYAACVPLDRVTLCGSVRKTGRAVVLEEGCSPMASAPSWRRRSKRVPSHYLDAPVRRVAAAEVPLPYSKPMELAALPSAAPLIDVIHQTLDATNFRG